MNIVYKVNNDILEPIVADLVMSALLNREISGNTDMDDLTIDEVHSMYNYKPVTKIIVDDVIVGFIYIDEKYRNMGYASATIKDHSSNYEYYAECCSVDNVSSNAVLSKSLKLHRTYYNRYRCENYNVYLK